MRRFKTLCGALARMMALIAPAVVCCLLTWSKTTALISILASIGAEALWLLALVLPVVLIERRKRRKAVSEDAGNGPAADA